MKRFFNKIFRFFWSWGFLKFVLGLIVLIILLYAEEDWRGDHAWAVTKAKWEAKGELFDFSKFIPRPVPDDQNLAAIPLFQIKEEKAAWGTYLGLPNLEQALRQGPGENAEIPSTGNWMTGERPDMAKIGQTIATDYGREFKDQKPPGGILAQFDVLFPFTADLRASAATRPCFRLDFDYATTPPALRSLGPLIKVLRLSEALTVHAILTLDHRQADLALADIESNYVMFSGVKRDPSLVAGLVALGMSAISESAIYHGLADHDWDASQLIELEKVLQPIDFLDHFQFAMRVEAAEVGSDAGYLKNSSRSNLSEIAFNATGAEARLIPWPGGWWYSNARQLADLHFEQLSTVDVQKHLIFPKQFHEIQERVWSEGQSWLAYAPWNVWFTEAASAQTGTMMKFAEGQVWIDEARIACALERYRLVHDIYPASLDALSPAYIDALPHDIMSGEPYHYQLRAGGAFLLYSVGWNQIDDGGKVVFKKGYTVKVIDYTGGDWVWPTPQVATSAR